MLSKRWHDGRLDSPRSVWSLHADRAGDWWPSSVPPTNQLSTTRTHTEQGVQIHLLWEFVGRISEEAWDQVFYHWRRSSSSTFKRDVLQLLYTFSTILVPSNSNLIYPIWINLANFNNPELINLRGLSVHVRIFRCAVLRATCFTSHRTCNPLNAGSSGASGWGKRRRRSGGLEVALVVMFFLLKTHWFGSGTSSDSSVFLILFGPKTFVSKFSLGECLCFWVFWVYQWLSIFRDKKCQFPEAHYKGRTAKNKTEEWPRGDVGMG